MSASLLNPFRFGAAAFDPTSIPGCVAWYDASDASTFTYSSAALVSQWASKTGTRHLLQPTATNQPNRSGTQNGLNIVAFDGVDNFMTCLGHGDGGTTRTAVFVMRQRTGSNNLGRQLSMDVSGGNPDYGGSDTCVYGIAYGDSYGLHGYRSSGNLDSGLTVTADAWYIAVSKFDGTNWTGYINGTAGTPRAASGTFSSSGNARLNVGQYPGDGNYAKLDVAEIAVYTTAMSDADRAVIGAAWKTKWGTP